MTKYEKHHDRWRIKKTPICDETVLYYCIKYFYSTRIIIINTKNKNKNGFNHKIWYATL